MKVAAGPDEQFSFLRRENGGGPRLFLLGGSPIVYDELQSISECCRNTELDESVYFVV